MAQTSLKTILMLYLAANHLITHGVTGMNDGKISVFFADDHEMVREALVALLAHEGDIEVVGQCGSGLAALSLVQELRPDVAILDITMPELNGLDVCKQLRRKRPKTAIVILTMHDDSQLVSRALEYGAAAFLLKDSAAERLCETVRAVANGKECIYPVGSGVDIDAGPVMEDNYEQLTPRERQVLQLIAEGQTSRKIAEALSLAVKTVDTHRNNMMHKLQIHDQTTLVKFALRKGIISMP